MMRWKELLEKKPHAWVKWGVIAACLCIVIAGFFVIRQRAAALPVEQVENPVSPEEIASQLGLGYSWFRRMFKEYTGVSPAQYQLQQKLLRAKELLTGSNLNISEIAYSLKFENAGQFSTFFKKKEGVTPSEFRERAH